MRQETEDIIVFNPKNKMNRNNSIIKYRKVMRRENNENSNNFNNSVSVQLENQNKVVMSKTGYKEIIEIENYKVRKRGFNKHLECKY